MSPSPRSLIRARQPHCEAWHDCARSVGAWCLIPGGRCIALTHCPSSGDRQHIASISHLTKGFSRKLSDLSSIEGTTWFSTIITQIILFGSSARICLMTNRLLVCRNNLECGSQGGQVGTLLTRMRRPTDAIYRAFPYRRAGSRFSG